MSRALLEISRAGSSGILTIGVGKDHSWQVEKELPWLDGTVGTWVRRTNSTKFRQFSFIELVNAAGTGVARILDFPYRLHDRFEGHLVARVLFLETDGDPFDVFVRLAPPEKRQFRIRESWSGSLSYVVAQAELCGFEIFDPQKNESAYYTYRGFGISFGPPIKRLPTIPGSATSSGPWNDFEAQGWMSVRDFDGDATLQTFYNVGMGTSMSMNSFEFAGNVDNFPGFLASVPNLQTGRTLSLPSTGFSSGSMRRR